MNEPQVLDIDTLGQARGLADRILGGEVVVARGCLQQAGLLESLRRATLDGIRGVAGEPAATTVARDGFDRIHESVTPDQIPSITDRTYQHLAATAVADLDRLVPQMFPEASGYYFERPNVRFHLPYDLVAAHQQQYKDFTKRRGEGKITAHGPHRDSWVDCPDNAINIWIAGGAVQRGNGLTLFTKEYHKSFAFTDGYIDGGVKLEAPVTFDLQPGDAVLFHSDHLHGSEINRTDRTRYAVSYRVTLGPPHYRYGHYHHYLHAGLAASPVPWLAGVPQNLQWSYVRDRIGRLRRRVAGRRTHMSGHDASAIATEGPAPTVTEDADLRVADFPVGAIRAASAGVCVARLSESEFVAIGRRCSHQGGDLAGGWIEDGRVVCPLHALPYDPHSGASPCASLRSLRRYPCDVRDGRVVISGHVSLGGE